MLKVLDISKNRIDVILLYYYAKKDEGGKAISEAISKSYWIENVNFSWNKLTIETGRVLLNVAGNFKNYIQINLWNNRVPVMLIYDILREISKIRNKKREKSCENAKSVLRRTKFDENDYYKVVAETENLRKETEELNEKYNIEYPVFDETKQRELKESSYIVKQADIINGRFTRINSQVNAVQSQIDELQEKINKESNEIIEKITGMRKINVNIQSNSIFS